MKVQFFHFHFGISQEFVIQDVQEEQFARFSPTELIKLAFFCALLEQTPHNPDKLVSRRFKLVKNFFKESSQVVPIESLWSAMAYSEDGKCAALCKDLTDKLVDSKIPPSVSSLRNQLLFLLQQENEFDLGREDILDLIDLAELCSVSLLQIGNILIKPFMIQFKFYMEDHEIFNYMESWIQMAKIMHGG